MSSWESCKKIKLGEINGKPLKEKDNHDSVPSRDIFYDFE